MVELGNYLYLLQEDVNNNRVYKVPAQIPIELCYNINMINQWKKWKPVNEELSYKRFNQYKNYFKDIDKYLETLDKITKLRISNIIKKVIVVVLADKRSKPYIGIGKNLSKSSNRDKCIMALGIESKPHVLVYFCHELCHSLIPVHKSWNKLQRELGHMMVEYFTDWRIWNLFNKGKNIFVSKEIGLEQFNKMIDKEYNKSNLSADKFTFDVVSRYKDYLNFIRIRK